MNTRKTSCLLLFVSLSLAATSATLLKLRHHESKLQCDGGAPVPPFPRLVTDGGAPVPPFPPKASTLVADGGAPVPPFPHKRSTLVTDGGAPVPPFPPTNA